jgi:beta-xylosidase
MMTDAPAILVGWKRDRTPHGYVVTLQLAGSAEDVRRQDYERVSLVVNDRQLRSLTRDLVRALDDRGLDAFHRPTGWRRWVALMRDRRRRPRSPR